MTLQAFSLQPETLSKKRLQQRCCSLIFAKKIEGTLKKFYKILKKFYRAPPRDCVRKAYLFDFD